MRKHMPYVILFSLVLVLAWAIHEVYPYPIAQPDTARYVRQGLEMQWGVLHYYDTWHPPAYSLLIAASSLFAEPAMTMYWLHSILFTASILVTYYVASQLFGSKRLGLCSALLFLGLEMLLFRVPFYNVMLLTEPLYIHCVFMGVSLVGLRLLQSGNVSLVGCVLLSIAMLTRKIGIVLFVLWVPIVAMYVAFRARHTSKAWLQQAVTALLILVFPLTVWLARTQWIKPENRGGLTSQYLAWRVGYIAHRHNIINSWRVRNRPIDREAALNGENADINRKILNVLDRSAGDVQTAELDALRWEVSFYILRHYFDEYLAAIAQDYVRFFSPEYIYSKEYIALKADPNMQYEEMVSKNIDAFTMNTMYPSGVPTGVSYRTNVSQYLQWLCCRNAFSRYVQTIGIEAFILLHLSIILSGVVFWFLFAKHRPIANVFGYIFILLCVAIVHAAATVLASGIEEVRLTLPSSLPIHFSLVLGITWVCRLFAKYVRQKKCA